MIKNPWSEHCLIDLQSYSADFNHTVKLSKSSCLLMTLIIFIANPQEGMKNKNIKAYVEQKL